MWIALLSLAGCGQADPTVKLLPTIPMQIGSKTYTLEIADDEAKRAHGLMERDTLPLDHGMIFVYPEVTHETFWMYHTRFPLDIIFIGPDAKVVSTAAMKAYDEHETRSAGVYKYAIELNAGQVAANGIKPGDSLQIPRAVLSK